MLLNLTEFSTESLHSQIFHQVLEKILNGDLLGGTELMSVRVLARTHHVNVQTVERAYKELEREGVVNSQNGEGIFVVSLSDEQKQIIARRRLLGHNSPLSVIDAFSKQLTAVFDPEKLRLILEEDIKDYLHIKNVYFVLRNESIDEFVLLPSDNFPNNVTLTKDDNCYQAITELKLPTPLQKIKCSGKGSKLQEELQRRNIQVIFPLKDAEQHLGFIALSEKTTGKPFLKEDIGILTILANQFATALTTARFYIETIEKRRMEQELKTARQIQQDLLPKKLPDNRQLQLAAYTEPSQTVGGDFYDYLPIDENRFGLVIADACGKGMPAAMLISQIQAILKSEINHDNPIRKTITHLNKHLKRHTSAQNFATLFYGIFDRSTGIFEFSNAGHNYPILARKNGKMEFLKTTGPALGILSNGGHKTETINVNSGDCILFYTDGITETMNSEGKEYGERNVQDLFNRSRNHSAQEIVHMIIKDLNVFNKSNVLHDDRTIMVMKMLNNEK